MAQNYIECGDVINFQNAGSAITSGSGVKIGALVGIALVDIAATSGQGNVAIEGVFKVAKATGAAWAQGDQLYWDDTAKNFNKTSSGNTPAGHAFEPAVTGDTVGYIRLLAKSA
jgi:predicted RecA/RadA family phage recombinase